MNSPRRIALIGLDALDARWLRRWMQEGRIPNVSRFADSSRVLDVASEGALLHGSVWPTFASGMSAGHHGIFWWTQWIAELGGYARNSHELLQYDPFWRSAALTGKRSIIVDVPYVPPVVDGHTWTAMGWGLHDEVAPASVPERFLPSIRARYGDHPLRMDTMHSMDPAAKLEMARQMARGVALRSRFVADMMARSDWDLFVTTFSEFHKVGHYLAATEQLSETETNDDALRSVIEPLEAALPDILARAGDDTDVVLFALHGIDPQVDYSRVAGQVAALADGRDVEAAAPSPDLLRRLRDLMPPQLQQAVWYLLPEDVRQRRYAATVAHGLEGDERLFHVANDGGVALRVNLAGREPDGTVRPDELQALLGHVAEVCRSMVTSDGLPAFGPLVEIATRYPGPRSHRLPDAIVPLNPNVFRADSVLVPNGPVLPNPQPEARNGIHTGTGFAFYRLGASADFRAAAIDSRDFAPTILARLGVAAPAALQGEPFLE